MRDDGTSLVSAQPALPSVDGREDEALLRAELEKESTIQSPRDQKDDAEKHGWMEPSLFHEAAEATLISASVFALADLRSLAHNKLISNEDAEEVLKLPITLKRLRSLEAKHHEHWKTFKSGDFTTNAEAVKKILEVPADMEVHHVGDENAIQECVHYIGRSHFRGRIVLAFRGTVTTNDWVQDFKLMVAKIRNPLAGVSGQPATVGIHMGFRNFMLRTKLNSTVTSLVSPLAGAKNDADENIVKSMANMEKEDTERGLSKMEIIINELRAMKKKYPNDPIFVCGHSLGGSLALIASLGICADAILGKIPPSAPSGMTPVTCYTVGNPKPGDGDFCKALEYFERHKTLRCCVMHNTWDVIPMLATNVALTETGFWHPGWRILLYKDRCEIGRGRDKVSQIHEEAENPQCACGCCRCCCCRRQNSEAMWNLPKGFNVLKAAKALGKQRLHTHDHREYLDRILFQQKYLRGLKLSSLYEEMWAETIDGEDDDKSTTGRHEELAGNAFMEDICDVIDV